MVPDEKMSKKPAVLLEAVRHLVRSPRERKILGEKLHAEAMPDSAKRLAQILIDVGERKQVGELQSEVKVKKQSRSKMKAKKAAAKKKTRAAKKAKTVKLAKKTAKRK